MEFVQNPVMQNLFWNLRYLKTTHMYTIPIKFLLSVTRSCSETGK